MRALGDADIAQFLAQTTPAQETNVHLKEVVRLLQEVSSKLTSLIDVATVSIPTPEPKQGKKR